MSSFQRANGVVLGIDVGGTFTDIVAIGRGRIVTAKVPTTPRDQSEGVMRAIGAVDVPIEQVKALAHGMTVGTNALLERAGAHTALVTTEGFRDVIEIGRQNRASLYDLKKDRPPPLVPRDLRFTIRERMGRDGVVEALDDAALSHTIELVAGANVQSVAVCLLFSFQNREHENRVAAALREALPGMHVSVSSEVVPEFREYERFATTVADAYLGPVVTNYLARLADKATAARLPRPVVMQSSGGVIDIGVAAERAAVCVLSGPAAGVVGAAFVGGECGFEHVLTFDMGGTSTDVAAIIGGRIQTTTDSAVAGVPIKLPMVDVHSVSAGGGSIAWIDDGGALRVGPRSAGADPGPAGYGRGGDAPTVTDANLILGYLAAGATLGGEVVLKAEPAAEALARLGNSTGMDVAEVALGVVEVANAEMARALRIISVERGLDPRDFALVAFGGAGPLHACALAEELGMNMILVPRAGGVLSALGLAISEWRRDYVRTFLRDLTEVNEGELEEVYEDMEGEAANDLPGANASRRADLRYRGQSFELEVAAPNMEGLRSRFEETHEKRYGYRMENEGVEIVNLRLVATIDRHRPRLAEPARTSGPSERSRRACFGGAWIEVPVLSRDEMDRSARVDGPAIVEFPEATCLIAASWRGQIDHTGTLVLRRIDA